MFQHSSSRHVCCFATLAKIIALFLLVEVTAQRKVFILEHVVIYNEILNRILTINSLLIDSSTPQTFTRSLVSSSNYICGKRCVANIVLLGKYQWNQLSNQITEPTSSTILWIVLGTRCNVFSGWPNKNSPHDCRQRGRYLPRSWHISFHTVYS
jgi:hypothetical protein